MTVIITENNKNDNGKTVLYYSLKTVYFSLVVFMNERTAKCPPPPTALHYYIIILLLKTTMMGWVRARR